MVCENLYCVDLFKGCKEASQTMRNTLLLPMYDVKAWLDPALNRLHNHSRPHIFKFLRDSTDNAIMLYKNWNEDTWLPEDNSGISLLKVSMLLIIVCVKDG